MPKKPMSKREIARSIEDIQNLNNRLVEDNASLEDSLASKAVDIEGLQTALDSKEESIQALEDSISDLLLSIAALEDRVEALEGV